VSDAKGEPSISAIAELIEPLGAETYLYAASGGHSMVARIPTGHKITLNQAATLSLDMTHAHFFDAGTGKAIAE
jgi:multiple sugar transport system ATP-binding protein